MNKELVLVDGSSYLYRAFHAMPALANSRNEPTGAVYGVANMLRRLLREYDPECVAVIFDAKGKTFRDEIYPEYKAHRPPMPTELAAQIEPLHTLIRAMGLPLLMVEGVEADDVIGTLTRQASAEGRNTVVSTGDKDLAQLIDQHVTLVNTMTDTRLDVAGVEERFGIPARLIVDYLALVGDTVDNIPGVPGVGPKTAVKWLRQYGSLDGIIAHANEISGKVGESLRACLGQLPLARQLATIHCDVPLPFRPGDLQRRPPDTDTLIALYQRLEFRGWLAELLPSRGTEPAAADTEPPPTPAADQNHYQAVLSEAELEHWLARLEAADLFAFAIETTSLDYMAAEIVGVSFAVQPSEAAYVPLAHDYLGAPAQLDRAAVLERLRPLLEDAGRAKVGHNLKYAMSVLANHGICLRGIRFDTMLESYVLDSTATRHDLDSLALKYLGHKTTTYEDVAGKGRDQIPFTQVPIERAMAYAAEEAEAALRLHQELLPRLTAEPACERVFATLEMPLVPVLSRMERNGVLIDAELLQVHSAELAARLRKVEAAAFEAAGQPFNLGSPKQIQCILYDKLKLPVLQKTPGGQPSTAESVLEELAALYPLPRLILEHRGLAKLKSTYTDRLPEQIDPGTGRVHTSFHQAVTSTGRLSSSNPNLQNIPVRNEEGRRIRQAFIAPPGYRLLAADYSQIELRIMAHLSGDARLLQAFSTGEDVHRATAAEVFGLEPEAVSQEQRRSAKAINFGLIYGMSAFGLARQLDIGRDAAQSYVNRYFERYPGVQAYMDRVRAHARQYGYVETVFGRRLHVPEINAPNAQRRQYAERTAINAPMQGTAADIIKRAMIGIDAWLQAGNIDARMIMQVHDELVFEVAEPALETAVAEIRQRMVAVVELSVPLVVDVGVGLNWDEAH